MRGCLIVKLAAAGDVLLTTALAAALRQAHPAQPIAWLTTPYAAPLLEHNPDVDEVLLWSGGAGGNWLRLRAWCRAQRPALVLLAHRSLRLQLLLRAAGGGRVVGWRSGRARLGLAAAARFQPQRHRLQLQSDLLAAAGFGGVQARAPRLVLTAAERAAGEAAWAGAGRPRWVLAAGGARNPWAAMPNRRWPSSRFLALAAAARARGIALRWVGSAEDRLEPGVEDCCGRLSLRHTAAVIAASDLVIGNDSLPLVMAQALGRAALGLYGPTDARSIHAPGQPFLQGQAGCGPCYDSRHGGRGRAYRCPRARCMEQISVQHVLQEAWHA